MRVGMQGGDRDHRFSVNWSPSQYSILDACSVISAMSDSLGPDVL